MEKSPYSPKQCRAALRHLQKVYTEQGQAACLDLARTRYTYMTTVGHCSGCDCVSSFIENECVVCGQLPLKHAQPKEAKGHIFLLDIRNGSKIQTFCASHPEKTMDDMIEADWTEAQRVRQEIIPSHMENMDGDFFQSTLKLQLYILHQKGWNLVETTSQISCGLTL